MPWRGDNLGFQFVLGLCEVLGHMLVTRDFQFLLWHILGAAMTSEWAEPLLLAHHLCRMLDLRSTWRLHIGSWVPCFYHVGLRGGFHYWRLPASVHWCPQWCLRPWLAHLHRFVALLFHAKGTSSNHHFFRIEAAFKLEITVSVFA